MANDHAIALRSGQELAVGSHAPENGSGGDATSPLDETRQVLASMARKRFGAIPTERIVEHVLAMTEGSDFWVREGAMEALLRRMSFAANDALAVVARPPRGALLGAYATARTPRGSSRSDRPYVTEIDRSPDSRTFGGGCNCPDFVRSSLGLCKHMLVVLDTLHREDADLEAPARRSRPAPPRLTWDPRLPLLGELDRLRGIRLESDPGAAELPAPLRGAFHGPSLRARVLAQPNARRALLAELRAELESRGSRRLVASPAARLVLDEESERAERRHRHRAHAPRAERELATLERKLYPYQRVGVRRLLEQGRLLLADDMGLGKTTQAIAACHALFRSRRVRRGLVIAPASLKPQWLREWQDTTRVPARVVDGSPEERRRIYREHEAGFLIVNYEQLLRDLEHIQALAPEMVVVDEAQRIKNYATKSAAYVKALDPEYRLILSGTPMENRLEELASLLDWIDDVALSPKWRLVPWYTEHDGDGDKGMSGARNLVTLRGRIAEATLRRVRRDVLAQLPSRTDTRVPVEMTSQQRVAHDDLSQPIAALVQAARRRPLTQAQFLRLMSLLTQQRIISNGLAQLAFDEVWPACSRRTATPAELERLFAPKLGALRALVTDLVLEQERKVVVFSQWRRMLRLAEWSVRDLLAGAGHRAVFFTGAENPAQKTRAIVDFHDDPETRVMFLSDAGGVGLNLQRAANACVNLELPWNPAVLEQRVGRIYRIGQKAPIDVYNLITEEGIEARIAGIIGAKQALFASVFEGTSDAVSFDASASFLSRVESLLDPVVPVAPSHRAAAELPEISEVDEIEAEVDGGEDGPAASAPAQPSPFVIPDLLAGVRVERTPDGGIRLEAPPHAAGALATMFDFMAQLLRASPPR
jgi:hypothetical protein